jgi:aryl-alcohol dehydrogenase-like predicted oxidoreductase
LIFPTLEELDITLVAFTPFSKGLLTGTFSKGVTFDPELDNRVRNPVFTDLSSDQNAPLLRLVADLAEAKGATTGQIALAWMLRKGRGSSRCRGRGTSTG